MNKFVKTTVSFGLGLLIVLGLFGCAAKSNMIPPKPLVEFKQTQKLKALWRVNVGDGTAGQYYILEPSISQGVVYTASTDGEVNAINATTGRRLWKISLPQSLAASVGVGDDKVFVGSTDGQLTALSKKDGSKIWHSSLPTLLYAKPVYSNGVLVVHLHNGVIEAFNANNGKVIWQHTASLPELLLMGNSTPTIYDGVVYVGLDNGEVWALNLKTGKRLWERPIAMPTGGSVVSRMIDIEGGPLIKNNVLYAATFQGKVTAINLENLSLKWSKPISTYVSLAIANDSLYASTDKGYLNAYDLSTGRILWSQKDLEGRQISAPTIVDGRYIAVGDFEGYLHLFNLKTGQYSARYNVGGDGIRAEPVAVSNRIYVQTNNGYLYAFKLG